MTNSVYPVLYNKITGVKEKTNKKERMVIMGLTSLFDSISTGFGCFMADMKYESAKAEARKEGIDVDALEEELYSSMGDCLQEEED